MNFACPFLVVLALIGGFVSPNLGAGDTMPNPESWSQKAINVTNVAARNIPVPTSASPELQALIANRPIPDFIPPDTAQGWLQLQKSLDEATAVSVEQLAQKLNVSIAPLRIGEVDCYAVTPKNVAPANANKVLVHIHGGAYVFGHGLAGTLEAVMMAAYSASRVISIDYRMPPEFPFPHGMNDVVSVWASLLESNDANNMALFGTSAGGGLALAVTQKLLQQRIDLPAALFLGTPWTDLSQTGDSYHLNAGVDQVLGQYDSFLAESALLYANGENLQSAFISPIYGEFAGLPPTVLVSGTRDLFLSNTVRVHRSLRRAGVAAELHVFEGQSHGDYLAPEIPEAEEVFAEAVEFLNRYLGR